MLGWFKFFRQRAQRELQEERAKLVSLMELERRLQEDLIDAAPASRAAQYRIESLQRVRLFRDELADMERELARLSKPDRLAA